MMRKALAFLVGLLVPVAAGAYVAQETCHYGEACRIPFYLFDHTDPTDFESNADVTLASGDIIYTCIVSGTSTRSTTQVDNTNVTEVGGDSFELELESTDTDCERIGLQIEDQGGSPVWFPAVITVTTVGNASAGIEGILTSVPNNLATTDNIGINLSDVSGTLDASEIGSNAITAAKIAADAIGASELATDAIGAAEIAADAITSAEIATGAIGTTEFAAETDIVSSGAITTSGGAVSTVTDVTNLHASAATSAELAKVPKSDGTASWNATALAAIEAEATDALEADELDHLMATSASGVNVADDSIIAQIVDDTATADWDGYDNTSASLIALQDWNNNILTDTAELQADWSNGGRLDVILDARASQTTADAIETDTQDIQTQIGTAGAGLINIDLPNQTMDITGTISTVTTVTNDVGVNEWNGVALGTTNPLPNAAADAAGGLVISDAGGLDVDAMNTNVSAIVEDVQVVAEIRDTAMRCTVDNTNFAPTTTAIQCDLVDFDASAITPSVVDKYEGLPMCNKTNTDDVFRDCRYIITTAQGTTDTNEWNFTVGRAWTAAPDNGSVFFISR